LGEDDAIETVGEEVEDLSITYSDEDIDEILDDIYDDTAADLKEYLLAAASYYASAVTTADTISEETTELIESTTEVSGGVYDSIV
jgi:hypothetical protein